MPRSESRSQKNGAKTLQLMTPVQPAEPSDYNSMGILTAPNGGMPPAENEEPEEKEEEEREQDHSDGATAVGGFGDGPTGGVVVDVASGTVRDNRRLRLRRLPAQTSFPARPSLQ